MPMNRLVNYLCGRPRTLDSLLNEVDDDLLPDVPKSGINTLTNEAQYWDEVMGIARECENTKEANSVVDNHQWIIYSNNHFPVLTYSDHPDAGDEVGTEFHDTFANLIQSYAYFAMRQDILKRSNHVAHDGS